MVSMNGIRGVFTRKTKLKEVADEETEVQSAIDRVGEINEGTASITAAATEVTVAHGYGSTPNLAQISVTPTNNLGDASAFWIGNVGSANFKIIIDAVPGSGNTADFVWQVV